MRAPVGPRKSENLVSLVPPGITQKAIMATTDNDTIRRHWRCFVACGLIILSPFQYGVDFGLIGGLQAMVGFLQVRSNQYPFVHWNSIKLTGLDLAYRYLVTGPRVQL